MVEVGNEEMRLGFLLVIHRIIRVTNVLGTIHDGAELAFVDAWDIEDDILHAFWQWRLAALGHLQFVTIEGLKGFRRREKEELPAMEGGVGIGSEVAEGGVALDVALLLVFGYEAQNVAPGVHAIEIPLSVISGIAAYAAFCVG